MSKPMVLFLCTGNSARSQMAEALLRKHAGEKFDVHSAGLDPQGINPLAARALNEVGISLEGHRSKSVEEYLGKCSPRVVIFVCERAEQSCPKMWPFALETDCWPFEDPASVEEGSEEEPIEKFRRIRDQIDRQIICWLEEQTETDESSVSRGGIDRESRSTNRFESDVGLNRRAR